MSGDSTRDPLDFKGQVNLLSVTKSLRNLHKFTSDEISKESNPTDLTFKFHNIKALSSYNSSLMHAKKCDSSDSDPVFKLNRRNTRRAEKKVRKTSSSSESDPVFKVKRSSSRKSRKRPASKSSTRKESEEDGSSSSEDCPVPPARSPPKRKRTEASSKTPEKKNQGGCSCGKEPERPTSLIRNILCFLGIERRRKNGSEGTSCHYHHHTCTCRNRKSRQNPERKVRQCQRESKSAGKENENEKSPTKCSVGAAEVKNESTDATVEDHSSCPCSYCPLRFAEVPSLDDIYLTEEVGNLIADAIKETVCQQLEEKLTNIEEEIKGNERAYWAEYIAPSMCPRCSSKDVCRLHSPSNQTRCHRCDNR